MVNQKLFALIFDVAALTLCFYGLTTANTQAIHYTDMRDKIVALHIVPLSGVSQVNETKILNNVVFAYSLMNIAFNLTFLAFFIKMILDVAAFLGQDIPPNPAIAWLKKRIPAAQEKKEPM